jgi:hypothetical protein
VGLLLGPTSGRCTHLLTVGHLFPPGATGDQARIWAATEPGAAPVPLGHLARNLLDEERALDVALVALEPAGLGALRPTGPASSSGIAVLGARGLGARAWLPSLRGWSGVLRVQARRHRAVIRAPLRPQPYVAGGLLAALPALSRPGDSGAPLATDEPLPRPLALLVGRIGATTVFEPLDRALVHLARTGQEALVPVEVPQRTWCT